MSEDTSSESGKKQGFWAKVAAEVKQASADTKKAAEEREAQARQAREAAGNLVTSQSFGGSKVEIYDGGYVRIAPLISETTPYEMLKSIKHSFQVQDKSTGGRALTGMATGGLNYLASKEKRTVFLTIVTDHRVHTLKATGSMGRSEDQAALGLETTGRGVLEALSAPMATPPAAPAPSNESSDALEQIKKLGELHSAGVLSDEEFASKKAELLNKI